MLSKTEIAQNVEIIITSQFDHLKREHEFEGYLSQEEIKYIHQISSKKRVQEFIYGRGFLRTLLGERLECSPESVVISYNQYHKPQLEFPVNRYLFFNVSHSYPMLIIAICKDFPIGVDIEKVELNEESHLLAPFFMTKDEHVIWEKTREIELFYQIWTQKEACLKCKGMGFHKDPAMYDIEKDFLSRGNSFINSSCYTTDYQKKYIYSWAICGMRI